MPKLSHAPDALDAVVTAGRAPVAAGLELLNAHLSGRDWMAAGKRTILDAYALPMLNWAQAKLSDGLAPFPAAARLHGRPLADAAVGGVMLAEGLVPEPGASRAAVHGQSR